MALNAEGVEDGCVCRQESLCRSRTLEALHLEFAPPRQKPTRHFAPGRFALTRPADQPFARALRSWPHTPEASQQPERRRQERRPRIYRPRCGLADARYRAV